MKTPMKLWYTEPAPAGNEDFGVFEWGKDRPDDGWEKWSLPIGNGNIGVCVFGRTLTERLQFSEKSLSNSYHVGGQNNFAEVYLDFDHEAVENYERSLDIEQGIASVKYRHQSVDYSRECFTSYPDNVFAMRIQASRRGQVSFTFRPTIPYLGERAGRLRKTGSISTEGDTVVLSGLQTEYGILYAGVFRVILCGGTLETMADRLVVRGADSVVVIGALGTNYRLESRVFLQRDPLKKLSPYPHPLPRVRALVGKAAKKGYDALRKVHVSDHHSLFGRVLLELGEAPMPDMPTDARLCAVKAGAVDAAFEALVFQYGRYLLIASSRPGTLPAHLQGAWNRYDHSPWSAGYWHNINVQMNYWPAFTTNLAETFEAYAEYYKAYLPLAKRHADRYVKACHPERYSKGSNGWIIGTGAWPYDVQGLEVKGHELEGHSGPGTGGLTSLLFWEYYLFTGDRNLLADLVYPALSSMSLYFSKVLVEHEGNLLVKYSASPEQRDLKTGKYYHTTGCLFDQQMIYENHKATLAAATELGIDDEFTTMLRAQVDRLDPVQIGASGQIKEFREEHEYGEIGEYNHRHISHLVGLYPGCGINSRTPEWMAGARKTLDLRGDESTGWGMAHRMLLRARAKDGEKAHELYRIMLRRTTYSNLWAAHPPFQIDANFGGTAGVAEMLLQSHEGVIELLPALPAAWKNGRFRGLVARGNFEVDAEWIDGVIASVWIHAKQGGECKIKLRGFQYPVTDPPINFIFDESESLMTFDTRKGDVVAISSSCEISSGSQNG